MGSFDIRKYMDMAARRKWWIIIPFLLTLLAGLTYALITPKIYEAQTLILVQSQKVPEDYVRAIVASDLNDRLRTITQQVTSRTNLERIIEEHHLFADSPHASTMEDKVMSLRERIKIDVSGGVSGREAKAFSISFRDKDPRKVMEVTNALASNFISENLRIRESHAMGTSTFISDELASVEKRLMEKEEELKQYREHNMGGLPEQLETNLNILERLQGQQDQLHSNLRDAENRKIFFQTQIAEQEKARAGSYIPSTPGAQGQGDLVSLRNELATLESRYTQSHPDVIRIRGMISKIEANRSDTGTGLAGGVSSISRVDQTLIRQFQDIELQIKTFRAEITKVRSQIAWYQGKVEETPKREQELLALNRDYENLNELYNSLLNRKLEAEIAVSMEKKQKGEQFRILDPAKVPSRPVEPDIMKIILMALALGAGLGCGFAYLVETMDTSFRSPEEAELGLQLPVLVSIPIRHTEEELRNIKMKKILTMTSVAAGFIVCAIGIVIATKGVDRALDLAERFLSGV
jgi:polysaccharide chain length determinant protein (PEP-CTERM system associated)